MSDEISSKTTILLASDHAGFPLKEKIKKHLLQSGKNIKDMGPSTEDRVDYPDFANLVAEKIQNEDQSDIFIGILVCGSGQGMSMRANKFSKIRAALCYNEESCLLSRQHNNSNILCLGERLIDYSLAIELVDLFLKTPFEGGRHSDRVSKICM